MDKVKIAIADDQNLFRQSLGLLIDSVEQFQLISESDNGNSFLEKLRAKNAESINIAIIDMDMPGMNGIELNTILHQQYPRIRVIVLSVHVQPLLITQMIGAGAAAYLAKNCDKDELITAIETVHKTGFYFNNSVLKAIQHSANHKAQTQKSINSTPVKLTEREKQVLQLICKEYNNAEIGEQLFLSTRTIEGHRNNLINKAGCRNTAGLVLFAIKYSLFQLPI
jgi:DNA-binding NarL/FixJ family response regulator